MATPVAFQISPAIFQDSVIFINSYSAVLARILSIYDGLYSPFRASALSTWRRSCLLFSVFQFFVRIYQFGFDSSLQARVKLDEARIALLGQLSSSLSAGTTSIIPQKIDILLVINMFGLSSSWYNLGDLGLGHYNAAVTLLRDTSNMSEQAHRFFEEFSVYWWMMLSFASRPDLRHVLDPPTLSHQSPSSPRMPHPLTGVSPESQLLLGMVGGLVLDHRRALMESAMTGAQIFIQEAEELEHRLLELRLPSADMVLDPCDPHTSVQDLLNIAEAYRRCALILLYHCYPDLLEAKSLNKKTRARAEGFEQRQSCLSFMALQVLHLLESNSDASGTRTIEAILLVIVSGELIQPGGSSPVLPMSAICPKMLQQSHGQSPCHDSEPMTTEKVVQARATILARFQRIQAILPFKTISRMKSLVDQAWRLMDSGTDVFWVDLLIKSKWQFLMI